LHARETLPSSWAKESSPTLFLMIFYSIVILTPPSFSFGVSDSI
jgi:hypothetical protein